MEKFKFRCPTCKTNEAEYEMREGVAQCDTPIGTMQITENRAYCKVCGTQLNCNELRNMNYILMVRTTMACWRNKNPNGTRKQCRRALGLNQATVNKFWDNCMNELPKHYSS